MPRLTAYTSVRFTDTVPYTNDAGELVVWRVGDFVKGVFFLCPCGCGGPHLLPTSHGADREPRWDVTIEADETVTVSPSILRIGGCASHFFIRHNNVDWC